MARAPKRKIVGMFFFPNVLYISLNALLLIIASIRVIATSFILLLLLLALLFDFTISSII
jgi:hypothetical protein